MVNHQPHSLDGIFSALSDPTRRAVLARLSEAPELSITTLAKPFAMSLPAVLKHLDVLEGAGLIARRKSGRTVSCRLNAVPMQEAQRWLARYERFWSSRLDSLERYLVEEAIQETSTASPPAHLDATSNPTPNVEQVPCPPTLSPPKSAVTASAQPSLTITRKLPASPERCFRAWSDPQALKQWFGPSDVEVVVAESDPRVGGRYRILMRSPGGEEHDVGGVFREVVANRKLVFTWAWRSTPERQSLVTVEFEPDGGATALTLTHEQFADEGARDRHRHGWTGSLGKLAAFLG